MTASSPRQPVTRQRGSDRPWTPVALALVVVIAAGVPAVEAQSSSECWEVAGAAQLAKKYSGYFSDNYEGAKRKLGPKGGSPADIEEAILRLQLAISQNSSSSATEYHPTEKREYAYFPYYWLGKAYAMKGNIECAHASFQREDPSIRRTELASDFESQSTLVASMHSLGALTALADNVVKRMQRPGEMLSPAGKTAAQKVSGLVDQIEGTSDLQARAGLQDRLSQAVLEMIETELKVRADRIESLLAAAWNLKQGDLGAGPADCRLPGRERDVGALEVAKNTLDQCVTKVDQAQKYAGIRACEVLGELQRKIREQIDLEKQFQTAAAGGEPPAIPDACGIAWASVDASERWAAIDSLGYPGNRKSLEDELASVKSRIGDKQEALRAGLRNARAMIPAVSNRCATDLRLSTRTLDDLGKRLDSAIGSSTLGPGGDLTDAESTIREELRRLAGEAVAGVDRLRQEREKYQCQNVDPTSLATASQSADNFRKSSQRSEIDRLCSAARGIKKAIDECKGDKIELVQADVAVVGWILTVASAWNEDLGLSCVDPSMNAIRGLPSQATAQGWVDRATAAVGEAEACLVEYRAERDRWTGGIVTDVEETSAVARQFPGIECKASLDECTATMQRLSPVLSIPTAELSAEALRRALETAGVAGNVPAQSWTRLSSLSGMDATEATEAIRDEATRTDLTTVAATLARCGPLIAKLGPSRSLTAAFSAFGQGDVDRAILELRSSGGDFGEDASDVAALRHAALSYFLFTKMRMLDARAEGAEVAGLLRDDATAQARLAIRVEPEFRLSASLFIGESFRTFFDSCRREVN